MISRRTQIIGGCFAVLLAAASCDGWGNTRGPGDDEPGDTTADASSDETDTSSACDGTSCVDERFRVDARRSCETSGTNSSAPPRCNEDPTSFSGWGPASTLTRVEIVSDEARDCCFNLDGSDDGSADNAFAELLSELPLAVDRQLQNHLLAGTYVGLVEFQGLEAPSALGETDAVNIHLGAFGSDESLNYLSKVDSSCSFSESACELEGRSGERFLVHPTTLESGTHPEVQLRPVTISGDTLRAGPGTLPLQFTVRGMGRHELPVQGATLEATIDRSASDAGSGGVVIEQGRIGGYVEMTDMIDLLNGLVSHCGCLDRPNDAVTYPNSDPSDPDFTTTACEREAAAPEKCRVQCRNEVLAKQGCSQLSNILCRRFDAICLGIDTLVRKADLDSDGDGYLDAISFGAQFEATGADIDGVANYVRASDRRPGPDGQVVIDRVFNNEPGWVTVYEPQGSSSKLVGKKRLPPGNHTDVAVDVGAVESPRPMMVVPFADDGNSRGTFEPALDSQLRYYPGGQLVSTSVEIDPR